ncbi:MAG: hypothetical protein HKN17_05150 [Rhodothermales bacterium]|nr:hypothetical protein [Rhodothermales bacterium]
MFVERGGLHGPGIYYGDAPEGLPDGVVRIRPGRATAEFFDRRDRKWPESVVFADLDGSRIAVPFSATGDLDIDVVATTFYFLSGWQELVPGPRDEHGRFLFKESFQARFRTRDVPVVDCMRRLLADALRERGAALERKTWGGSSWAFCPTHDIDYLRKWRRGIYWREVVLDGLLNRRHERPTRRVRRIARAAGALVSRGDPYESASYRMIDEVRRRDGRSTYFLKAGATAPHDVRMDLVSKVGRRLIRAVTEAGFEIGLHPSYHASMHPDHLEDELDRLRRAAAADVRSIRSHYLRFDHPETMRLWSTSTLTEALEPTIDSTLGFSETAGFRHGTCLPFPLFDPDLNEATGVWEMPLVCMESALFNRMGLTTAEAIGETIHLLDQVRTHGGVFTGLWHNTLWDEWDAPGWGEHFTATLDRAVEGGARMDSLGGALDSWR